MAQRRQNPDFQPVRITAPVTAPVTQFYDPSALVQQQDFQNSMEIAKAFSGLSSSLAGFAQTFTKAEIKAGEEEFAALAATPQKLRAKATEYIESAGRLAPWRVRSFLQMYGGQTYGSQYRSGVFNEIDSLSEPMNLDGTIKTDQQVQAEINAIADRLEVPDSYYVQQGFNRARLGIDNELMNRVGQLRVAKAKQATEDQAMTEALELIQRTVNPDDIEKGLGTILKNIYSTGLGLTSGGREAVIRAVATHVDRELNAADPDYDRVDELLSIFTDGQVGDLKLTPELMGAVEELRNKAEKAQRFVAFANSTNEIVLKSQASVTDLVLQWMGEKGRDPSPSELNNLITPFLTEGYPNTPSDIRNAAREKLRDHALQVVQQQSIHLAQQVDDPDTLIALHLAIRNYEDGVQERIQTAFSTREIGLSTYTQLMNELRESNASTVNDAEPLFIQLTPLTAVVPQNISSTLTAAELRDLEGQIAAKRSLIFRSVAADVVRSAEFRTFMSQGNVLAAQRMLIDTAIAEWGDGLAALKTEAASFVDTSFENLRQVVLERGMPRIVNEASTIFPDDAMPGGLGFDQDKADRRTEYRVFLEQQVLEQVAETVASRGRENVNQLTFGDSWFLAALEKARSAFAEMKRGQGLGFGEEPALAAVGQLPSGRETEWSNKIALAIAKRGEAGESDAQAALANEARAAVARIRMKIDNERKVANTVTYMVQGLSSVSSQSTRVLFEKTKHWAIETSNGVAISPMPGFFDGGMLQVVVPYSKENWKSLSKEQQNRAITEALGRQSEVDRRATQDRVFDLGMIGFDINELATSRIGAMDVVRGRPFESSSDPFSTDLQLGPPNPKAFLYGTPEQWEQMKQDYDQYEQTGNIPTGPLQDLLDFFDNSFNPRQIMLLQGGLRVIRGLEPRN